ncbi:MAG: hypothetical protein EPO07_06125 [Verrucomicrobia bacterium]|nr:MAG: hypothetical protein EPO07_06125 [Verrucomicrobiota bacterium]
MKRAWLAILILATGTVVFCSLRGATADFRAELLNRQSAWQTQTQQLAHLRIEREELVEKARAIREELASLPPASPALQLMQRILSRSDRHNLSAEETEQLLAEFGFNWNTTGDFLIVSKKSLNGISLEGMKDDKMTAAARAVLAISPEERAVLETLTKQLGTEREAWVVAHAQREEPGGKVLAKYSLPVDAEFSQSLSNAFTSGIFATLGNERAELLREYSYSWMQAVGMLGGPAVRGIYESEPITLLVERYRAGDSWNMNYTLKQAGNTMTTSVNPWQPFPEAFKPLFPNGWIDVAAREGFELPKEFKKKPANP